MIVKTKMTLSHSQPPMSVVLKVKKYFGKKVYRECALEEGKERY